MEELGSESLWKETSQHIKDVQTKLKYYNNLNDQYHKKYFLKDEKIQYVQAIRNSAAFVIQIYKALNTNQFAKIFKLIEKRTETEKIKIDTMQKSDYKSLVISCIFGFLSFIIFQNQVVCIGVLALVYCVCNFYFFKKKLGGKDDFLFQVQDWYMHQSELMRRIIELIKKESRVSNDILDLLVKNDIHELYLKSINTKK